ncbi:probable thiopurine S-methyltransferase [Rhipicephalus sanguineus]|uniref:probable thiopurine S-methyltransferase n=1 Tax=Rhipicephalus sanguineus TaxID=34632 RepID=UPI0018962F0E|nr:probable thiopurine S-methyltransferase [Rhipicephalus sanguineus]
MDGASQRKRAAFWRTLYEEKRATWQQQGVTKFLLDNKDRIIGGKTDARVFIPLCGKAHELKWFYDLGHRVVGVEFVEEAVRSYFIEKDLPMEEATCPITQCKVIGTTDHRLQVFVCDIFDFKRECAGVFDIVWDRSGFTVIGVEDRARYAAVIKNLLAADFSYGMWTIVYSMHNRDPNARDVAADIALVDGEVYQKACAQHCSVVGVVFMGTKVKVESAPADVVEMVTLLPSAQCGVRIRMLLRELFILY